MANEYRLHWAGAEVWYEAHLNPVRVHALAAETWSVYPVSARLHWAGLESWGVYPSAARLHQTGVEVWYGVDPVAGAPRRQLSATF